MAADMRQTHDAQHEHLSDHDGYSRFQDPAPRRARAQGQVESAPEPSRGKYEHEIDPTPRNQSSSDDGPPTVKKICVTTAGPYPVQKPFVMNRFVKSYSRFLDEIRERLGCDQSIRCLKSPGGTRVRSLENLRGNNTVYTAMCPNDLVRNAFGGLPNNLPPMRHPARRPRFDLIPRTNQYNYVPSRVMDELNYRCKCIHVFLNADFHRRPQRILIDRRIERQRRPLDLLLKLIEEKVVTKSTRPVCVRKLYDLNTGRPVREFADIEDGMTLVACPQFERLIPGDYGMVERALQCGKPPSSKKRAFLSKTPTPPEGRARPGYSNDNSPRHGDIDVRGQPASQRNQINPLAPLPPINRKAQTRDQHQNQAAEPEDDFKAKKTNEVTRGAREVEETQETVTELPVERQKAEEVQEEEQPDDRMEEDAYNQNVRNNAEKSLLSSIG